MYSLIALLHYCSWKNYNESKTTNDEDEALVCIILLPLVYIMLINYLFMLYII